MVSGKGYAVLAHILRQLPSSAFCPNFVKCLIAVYTKMDSIPSARALQDSLYSDLLTNFFVWVRTPYETQKELLSQLYILHSSGKRVISAKSALDILRMFYWLDNTGHTKKMSRKKREYNEKDERNAKDVISDSSDDDEKDDDDDNNNNDEGTSDDNDDDTVNTRLCSDAPFRTDKNAYTELCALRESIFSVVKAKIGQAPELEDVEAVVRFTFWAGCTNRKKHLKVLESEQGDLLGILRVIDDAFEQGSAVFTDAFASIDGAEALLRLLAFKSEVVHVRVIGALARFCYAQLSVSAGRKRVCEIAGSLLEGLADVPVTAVLYNALLKMVIADFSTSDTVEVTHMTNLVLPEAMCICLFPLLRHASQEDRVRAYSDIGTILAKRTNAQCLIEKVRSWQFHLCKLLDGERESFIAWMRTRKEGEDVAESEEIARIIELLGSILSNTVFEAIMLCMDWSEVDALLTLLRVYDAMPVDNAAASLPPNNYFHLCRLAFFKAFTASIARIVNGEAQVEYRDAACATAPQFPFFVSFCVNAVDTLLLIAPSVARPYIYPKCKYSYNQQQQQQQQKGLQKQLARFSPKRIKDSQSACGKDDRAASAQLAPRFESRNIGDAVDPSSSPSDPDFELFILSNILAYVDYLRLCTTSGWGGAEKEKGASPVLQLRPGGFIVLCAITSARILQLHALVGWKDEGRRCKAALALLQTISESLAPQEDEGTANEGFYWIMETTIHSFCVAVTHENMAVAEEIFKLIFTFMRYIGKFKKLGKFISKGSEDAVSILATIAETNSVMDVRNMFVSTAWEPASEEICRRARPWVQAALCGYKKTLIASKKSDEAAVKLAGMAAKQPCLIDSFAACAKVYSLEIFRLEAHALRSSAIQQTNAVTTFFCHSPVPT